MKITCDGATIEGTPEEIKEMMTAMGVEFPVKDSEKVTEDSRTFSEGDQVKTLADGQFYGIKSGEVGEVTDIDMGLSDDDPYSIRVGTEDDFDYFRPQDLELVDEDKSKLKVGDYAKVIRADKFNVGDIVYIYDEDSVHFEAGRVNDPYYYWNYADKEGELVKATDEEIKMAELGRKPGEFKKGDIVRVTGGGVYRKGTIGEVTEIDDRGGFRVETSGRRSGNWLGNHNVELIAPVESRVDTQC